MRFEYTVSGEYITTDGGLDEYEAKFVLDEKSESMARSIIQNTIIHNYLKKDKKLKDYKRWKTCQIDDCKAVEKEAEISEELQKLIAEATDLGCIPSNFNAIKKEETKIKKLTENIERKKARIKKEEEKNRKQQA